MKQIREYFEKMVEMTDGDWEIFSSKLIKREFPKRFPILKAGKTERYLSFIEKGIIRFFIPKDAYDLTFGFSFENEFVSAYDSFVVQVPSKYQIESLSPVILWSIEYKDLQDIYRETKVGNTIGRYAAENLYLIKSKRELSLLDETAEERYLKLFSERPHLLKHIPLKYLASYIGITPQALSRIRKRIS